MIERRFLRPTKGFIPTRHTRIRDMNKTITLITIAILVSGCASTDYARITEEQHQAAKTKYYENINLGRFNAQDEVDAESSAALAEL